LRKRRETLWAKQEKDRKKRAGAGEKLRKQKKKAEIKPRGKQTWQKARGFKFPM